MGSVQTFVPTKSTRFLDPDHARIASEAFEAALHSLDGKASTHRLRHLLASFIVERVMHGEIDVNQLALKAVESLDGRRQAPRRATDGARTIGLGADSIEKRDGAQAAN